MPNGRSNVGRPISIHFGNDIFFASYRSTRRSNGLSRIIVRGCRSDSTQSDCLSLVPKWRLLSKVVSSIRQRNNVCSSGFRKIAIRTADLLGANSMRKWTMTELQRLRDSKPRRELQVLEDCTRREEVNTHKKMHQLLTQNLRGYLGTGGRSPAYHKLRSLHISVWAGTVL